MSRHEKRGRIFSTMLDLDALFNGLKSSKNKSHAQNIPTSTMQHETPPFETVSDQLVTFAKKNCLKSVLGIKIQNAKMH